MATFCLLVLRKWVFILQSWWRFVHNEYRKVKKKAKGFILHVKKRHLFYDLTVMCCSSIYSWKLILEAGLFRNEIMNNCFSLFSLPLQLFQIQFYCKLSLICGCAMKTSVFFSATKLKERERERGYEQISVASFYLLIFRSQLVPFFNLQLKKK